MRTSRYFANLKEPKEIDARMRLELGDGEVLDGEFALLGGVVVGAGDVATDIECKDHEREAGVGERRGVCERERISGKRLTKNERDCVAILERTEMINGQKRLLRKKTWE